MNGRESFIVPAHSKRGGFDEKEKDILFTDHSHCHRCRRLDFTSEILGEKEILRRTVQKKNRDLKIGDKLC